MVNNLDKVGELTPITMVGNQLRAVAIVAMHIQVVMVKQNELITSFYELNNCPIRLDLQLILGQLSVTSPPAAIHSYLSVAVKISMGNGSLFQVILVALHAS